MKTHHKIIAIWCAAIVTMLGIAKVCTLLSSIDYFIERSVYNDEGCVRDTSFGASEDQTRFNNNSLLMTEWKIMDYQPGEDRPGAIYVASGFRHSDSSISTKEFVDQHLTIEKLPMAGFPEGVDFHPHGMVVHKSTSTLYVVNHAYERGGERIEVFDIGVDGNDSDSDNAVPNKLQYKYSITSDWMKNEMNGILNSLVVVAPNKFYVSQYEAHAQDRSQDGWLSIDTKSKLELTKNLFFKPKTTFVWYCEYNDDDNASNDESTSTSSPLDCRKVADGFAMANGMTANSNYSKIFVVDTLERTFTIFDRVSLTNDLTNRITVNHPFSIDNIKYDDNTGNIYGGGITNVFSSFKNNALVPGQHTETSTSGLYELSYSFSDHQSNKHKKPHKIKNKDGWTSRTKISTSKLNLVTNGVRMNSHYVMGSGIAFHGILVCPVVDKDDETYLARTTSSEL